VLLIDNEVVARVLTMRDCIAAQEAAFAALVSGEALTRPRIDIYAPCDREDGYFRWGSTEGVSDGVLAVRLKADVVAWPVASDGSRTEQKYCVQPGTYCGLVLLFSTGNGAPLAILNDGHLQHMRVGGAAGLGTKLLARADATTVGMIGSGGMARTFLQGIAEVRSISRVNVYSRSGDNRRSYAEQMSTELGIEIIPVTTPHDAVRGVDIVATCTDSMGPVLEPEWLEPGMHVVTLGPREISPAVAERFDIRIRQGDDVYTPGDGGAFRKDVAGRGGAYGAGTEEQQRRLPEVARGARLRTDDWPVYTDVITGRAVGRTRGDQITCYRTIGNWGVQFSSVGALVLRRATELGLGRALPIEWFLQDIRN
jgi:alanine dehydrogenase